MSDTEFDLRLKHIEEQYAARKEGADAYRDQEVARLFEQCGWSQDRIARHLGKKQAWVSKRLTLGRFLSFIPTGNNSPIVNLTERRFREYYEAACRAFPGKHQSQEKEENRFRYILNAIENGVPQGMQAIKKKVGLRPVMLEILSGDDWLSANELTEKVEKKLVGITPTQIRNSITELNRSGRIDTRKSGKTVRYRLRRSSVRTHGLDPEDICTKLDPIIKELKHWGNSSRYEQAPGELLKLAVMLERIVESLTTAQKA